MTIKHPSPIFYTFLLLCCLFGNITFAQTSVLKELNENLIEIESVQPNDNFVNFDQFSKVLTNNKILAIGEVTHGIKEFMAFRVTLIKHLVTKLNYKVIVLESDLSGAKLINDYILYNKGDKYDRIKGLLPIWQNDEFLNLIDWLKSYNLTQTSENKVKIYGCDMQYTLTAAKIANGSIKLKTEISDDAKKGLAVLKNIFVKASAQDKELLKKLKAELSEEIAILSDTALSSRSITTVIQSIEWFLTGDWYKRDIIRDKYMAENVSWIYEYENKDKMVFLAHNTHIAKKPVYDDVNRAGFYLKQQYADGYYALGLSFFTGEFLGTNEKTRKLEVFTIPEINNERSSEYIFSQSRTPNFILDFESNMQNPVIKTFLTTDTYSKNIGSSYIKTSKDRKLAYMPLVDKFDGIGFFRRASAILPGITSSQKQ
ncbi:MAG: erythromycin esterase family protein [Pedobacter sp.]|nr:MAG: erythromycin esterase family protein [Pedobacter sp.]